ncbi:sel1 repeat family protein [Candidatus Poribacteria bacterium]|nr:sel1 repeat family protein [Candidatus Poribacteria bacterium]
MRDRPKDLEKGIEAFQNEDYSKAFSLLMPLAKAGFAQAQCYIASMYHGGFGVPVDGPKAVKWYRKAAAQGETQEHISAVAYNNLGTIYSAGMPGVSVDHRLTRKCWCKAAELGFEMIPPPREIW